MSEQKPLPKCRAEMYATTDPGKFWDRVEVRSPNSCWYWLGSKHAKGYGLYGTVSAGKSRMLLAHRWSVHISGRTPKADQLVDHMCMNRLCVNPLHLRLVDVTTSNLENSNCVTAVNARKTHCKRGHSFDDKNTRRVPSGGRECRTCHREKVARLATRKKEGP